MHGTLHGLGTRLGRVTHLGGALVSALGCLGIVLHGSRQGIDAGRRLLQARGLLLRAFGQSAAVVRQTFPRMGHQRGIAADVCHHGGQRAHHAIEQARHPRQLVIPADFRTGTQVTARDLLHNARDVCQAAGLAGIQRQDEVCGQRCAHASGPPCGGALQPGRRHKRAAQGARHQCQLAPKGQTPHQPDPRP